jgi:hypothetical protein
VAAAYAWVASAIGEFTLTAFGGMSILDIVKTDWMEHVKPNVKAAALSVLVAVYKQTGEPLRSVLVEGLKNPKTLEEALAKVPAEEVGKPIPGARAIRGVGVLQPPSFEDLVPRVDVNRQLDSCIKQLADENWRIKKEVCYSCP